LQLVVVRGGQAWAVRDLLRHLQKRHWLRDFTESIIIWTEKKQEATKCVDFRAISLSAPTSKILLRFQNGIFQRSLINIAWREDGIHHTIVTFWVISEKIAYLIFDRSDVALCSPVDRVWELKLYVWRQICCAISWSVVHMTTITIHQLCILSRLLQCTSERQHKSTC